MENWQKVTSKKKRQRSKNAIKTKSISTIRTNQDKASNEKAIKTKPVLPIRTINVYAYPNITRLKQSRARQLLLKHQHNRRRRQMHPKKYFIKTKWPFMKTKWPKKNPKYILYYTFRPTKYTERVTVYFKQLHSHRGASRPRITITRRSKKVIVTKRLKRNTNIVFNMKTIKKLRKKFIKKTEESKKANEKIFKKRFTIILKTFDVNRYREITDPLKNDIKKTEGQILKGSRSTLPGRAEKLVDQEIIEELFGMEKSTGNIPNFKINKGKVKAKKNTPCD